MPDYIGAAAPAHLVQVRKGRFARYGSPSDHGGYQLWDQVHYPVHAAVGKAEEGRPWCSTWEPDPAHPYVTIPNILSIKLEKAQDGSGLSTAVIEIENIDYPDAGGFHIRERGAFSPLRTYTAPGTLGQPAMTPLTGEWGEALVPNEWKGRFLYQAQITVWQGWGTPLAKTFTGLIEETDMTSRPDRIIITARCFGQVLTDEYLYGWNKDPRIKPPVVFIDKEQAETISLVGYNPHASSNDPGEGGVEKAYDATQAIDWDSSSYWRSAAHGASGNTEWIEIALKDGLYQDYDLYPFYANMDCYVSLRPAARPSGEPAKRNGVALTAGEWVDLGHGNVPGTGVPWLRHEVGLSNAKMNRFFIDTGLGKYEIGPNSILRLSFNPLGPASPLGKFRAGVREFHARKQSTTGESIANKWVEVEWLDDVVKVLLRWAGFKEWEVEETGVRLRKRQVFHKDKSYLDAIKVIAEAGGFEFFIKDPAGAMVGGVDTHPESLGIPVFRKSQVVQNVAPVGTVTDRSLLNAIQLKQSNEELHYIIRVWGSTDPKTHSNNAENAIEADGGAVPVGGKRVIYTFRPPWTGTPTEYADSRLAGIIKHAFFENHFFATVDDCMFGAFYIALQEALASIEATIDFPANPAFELDEHCLLMDLGTGLTTRLSVAKRTSTMTCGEKASWTMQLTGPLIDTPDVRAMVNIINNPDLANGQGSIGGGPGEGVLNDIGYG